MHGRWPKTFSARSKDRISIHDRKRAGDGGPLYCAQKSLPCGAGGGGRGLRIFPRDEPYLCANGLSEKASGTDAVAYLQRGACGHVPVYVRRVRDRGKAVDFGRSSHRTHRGSAEKFASGAKRFLVLSNGLSFPRNRAL